MKKRTEERTSMKRKEERLRMSRGRRCLFEFLWGDAGMFFKCTVECRLGIESCVEGNSQDVEVLMLLSQELLAFLNSIRVDEFSKVLLKGFIDNLRYVAWGNFELLGKIV